MKKYNKNQQHYSAHNYIQLPPRVYAKIPSTNHSDFICEEFMFEEKPLKNL